MNSTHIKYVPGAYDAMEAAILAAIAAGESTVVLDLNTVETLDANGVRQLITLLRRARSAGGELALRSTKADVLRTLSVTALDRIFEVVPPQAA